MVTTVATVPPGANVTVDLVARAPGVVAGVRLRLWCLRTSRPQRIGRLTLRKIAAMAMPLW